MRIQIRSFNMRLVPCATRASTASKFKQKMLELGPLSEQPGAIQFESMAEFVAVDLIQDKNEITIPEL